MEKSNPEINLERSLSTVIKTEWRWWLPGAVFGFLLASVLMSGWPAGLIPNTRYPYSYHGDSLFYLWIIQRLQEGWVFSNLRSGYPFGSDFYDFPGADFASLLLLKWIAGVSGHGYIAFNIYYLLSYAINFVSAFCVLRTMKLAMPLALSAALLYDFLPFHADRIRHLYYTWYFIVPVFYYLAFKIVLKKSSTDSSSLWPYSKIFYPAALLILGSFGVYYDVFGLIVLLLATVSANVSRFDRKSLGFGVFACGMIGLSVLLNLAPNLYHLQRDGRNVEVAQRSANESEIYGFKLAQLVLPHQGHRHPQWAAIADDYARNFPLVNENRSSSLGVIGALGLLFLAATILFRLSGRAGDPLLSFVALTVLVLFMFGTVGGFGALFALFVSPLIRGWNRIVVFVGFGCLLAFFWMLQMQLNRYLSGKKLRIAALFLGGMLSCVGIYDQTTALCLPCNQAIQTEFDQDRAFVQAIEQAMPPGSAIYQLPYMSFPESPHLNQLQSYSLASGVIDSVKLRWSFAGSSGRAGDLFYRSLSKESIPRQLAVIRKIGMSGIYIDTRAYPDQGRAEIADWSAALGAPPSLMRADGRQVFFRTPALAPKTESAGLSPMQIMLKAGYVADHLGPRYAADWAQGIDFRRGDFPQFVKDVQGLSGVEKWGRWSDAALAPVVAIDFTQALPAHFTLRLIARPFIPALNRQLVLRFGSRIYRFSLRPGMSEYRQIIDLQGETVLRMELQVAHAVSPWELGQGGDRRKLGIGLVELHFEK